MQKLISVLTVVLLSSFFSLNAQAEYYGLKAGDLELNNVYENVNGKARLYGVVIGKLKGQGQAVEIVYNKLDSIKEALPTDADFSIKTYGLYSVARTNERNYFKSKLGYIIEKADIAGVTETEKGVSLGVGFGYRLGGTSMIELEYTWVTKDLKFVSLSYIF